MLATDADEALLARARRGCYPRGSLRELPPEWRARAFLGTHGPADSSDTHGAADSSDTHGPADSSGTHGAADSSDTHGPADSSGTHGTADPSGTHGAADASGTHDAADSSGIHGAADASGTHGAADASDSDDEPCIDSAYREGVTFLRQDLRTEMPDGPFHLVLCRNVAFTYFAPPLQLEVLARLRTRLVPGGLLAIGGHESLPEHGAEWTRAAGALPLFRKTSS
ncbi:hypothetical protein JY651_44015 [Pyxidicoccus parkwayensis]|uniref:CheR-type methyltransferase domain-containing protein n=1 Tax=Pyxidicoccus parkwayensis TaxID=2813578 RepID=A0ABX7PDJ1_9BACT|nr:hypothetical protein JY651_44015 [Pyxidicoccus parkwaysis]